MPSKYQMALRNGGLERDISRYMTWARRGQKFTIPVCLAPGAWRVPLQMLLPPQILVHSHLPRLGCLERELCFKTGEAILKSHVLPKARRGQHNNWAGSSFPLVFSHYVPPAMNQAQAVVWPSSGQVITNPQVSPWALAAISPLHLPLSSPQWGRLVRQRRSLDTVGRGPLAPLLRDKSLDISTHGLVWRDQRDSVGASSPRPCPCPFPGSLAVGAECDTPLGRPD